MKRQTYPRRVIVIRTESDKRMAMTILGNMLPDPENPLQANFGEVDKPRTLDQNALMWAGPLKDFENQVYLCGQTYSAEAWNHELKKKFLPEEYEEGITKKDYQKWTFTPSGERILVGSTTDLLVKGMALYLEQIYAYGVTEFGIQFGVDERRFA